MFVKLGPGAVAPAPTCISPQAAAGARPAPGPRAPRAARRRSPRCSRRSSTRRVDEVFPGFDWQPVAAASIGQVYRAQLPDGAPVVVKVQRPGIDESVRGRPRRCSKSSGTSIETRTIVGREYRVDDLVDEFSARLREELDYRIEARNAHAIAADAARRTRASACPYVYDELSTSRVLVMEWLDGASVREVDWSDVRDRRSREARRLAAAHVPRADAAGGRVPRRPASRAT